MFVCRHVPLSQSPTQQISSAVGGLFIVIIGIIVIMINSPHLRTAKCSAPVYCDHDYCPHLRTAQCSSPAHAVSLFRSLQFTSFTHCKVLCTSSRSLPLSWWFWIIVLRPFFFIFYFSLFFFNFLYFSLIFLFFFNFL